MSDRTRRERHREARRTNLTTLDKATAGDRLVVGRVGDDSARIHAIRFGMTEGSEVTCLTRIPGGPIVLKCGRQEIAVGRKLAACINVRLCATAYAPTETEQSASARKAG